MSPAPTQGSPRKLPDTGRTSEDIWWEIKAQGHILGAGRWAAGPGWAVSLARLGKEAPLKGIVRAGAGESRGYRDVAFQHETACLRGPLALALGPPLLPPLQVPRPREDEPQNQESPHVAVHVSTKATDYISASPMTTQESNMKSRRP